MRPFALLLLVACHGGETDDTAPPIPDDCEVVDPGGDTCAVAAECRVECVCSNGSRVTVERCEGTCPTNDSQCGVACQAVGWGGFACAP